MRFKQWLASSGNLRLIHDLCQIDSGGARKDSETGLEADTLSTPPRKGKASS